DCICNPKKGNAPISDGPFLLTKFDRGSGITLEKNKAGWYGSPAKLDSIVWRFVTNTNSEIQAIRGGEVDAIYPQPQLALADLRGPQLHQGCGRDLQLWWYAAVVPVRVDARQQAA